MALGYPVFSTQKQRIPLQSFELLGRPPASRFAHWDIVQTFEGAVLKILLKALKQSFKQKNPKREIIEKATKIQFKRQSQILTITYLKANIAEKPSE